MVQAANASVAMPLPAVRAAAHAPSIAARLVFVAMAFGLALACDKGGSSGDPSSAPSAMCDPTGASPSASARVAALPPRPWKAAAIAHGGVGSPPENSDGCRAAVDAAMKAIESGADPLDAAMAGVVVMEDDPRFNAGTGSAVRLDGVTVQMDASIMSSDGRFGAVAQIEQVKNPIKVARAVVDTPHRLLAGDGATRFARTLGMPPYDPSTDARRAVSHRMQSDLVGGAETVPEAWRAFDWRARWNFDVPIAKAGFPPGSVANAQSTDAASKLDAGHDTVGVAVRASDGRFAVALSTGGMSLAMKGRVGDVPILGAGLFSGSHGAAAATGAGERIMDAMLARAVEEWLAAGATPQAAAQRAVDLVRSKGDIGIVVIGATAMAAAADRPMAWAARESGASAWMGPEPAPHP